MPKAVVRCDRHSTKEAVVAEIALRAVSKRFGAIEAVRDLSLSIGHGEFVVLLGPTGAGKTTTLRLIAGLERPDRGDVLINGRVVTDLAPAARDVAFVFQQYSLYPHLTVFDNLAFPLRSPVRRLDEQTIRRRAMQVAALLRIDHKLGNRSTALSGGEMQRVAIGRALVREPAIYLMDEPLSSLDAKLRAELRLELKRLQIELGATILYVTHDQTEALTMADRIGVIDNGRLLQLDTPRAIYERPRDTYVASRLGTPPINLIPVTLWQAAAHPPRARTVGARTEHIRIIPAEHAAGSTKRQLADVQRIEHLGDQNHVHLDFDGHPLVTLADPALPLKAGDRVSLELGDALYFDDTGMRVERGSPTGEARA
jgi:multiple sugar transport system ATP-binding protein